MQNQSRKVALILDLCRAHYTNVNLTNVKFFYLPPFTFTTSITQPLDAGIINSMKCNYKKRLIHKLLLSYDVWEVENFEYLFNRLKNYCPIPNEVCYKDFVNADGLVTSRILKKSIINLLSSIWILKTLMWKITIMK